MDTLTANNGSGEQDMDQAILHLKNFLDQIQFGSIFFFVPVALMVLCVAARLACYFMLMVFPRKFSHDHQANFNKIARYCYWFSVLIQGLFWLLGTKEQIITLRDVDYLCGAIMAVIAVVCVVSAIVSMFIKRHGVRVFLSKRLMKLALGLILMALFLCAFAYLFSFVF